MYACACLFKGTVKEKMKGGIGRKLITFALDRDPWKLYLVFLSRGIDIKLKLCLYAAELPPMRVEYTGQVQGVPKNMGIQCNT